MGIKVGSCGIMCWGNGGTIGVGAIGWANACCCADGVAYRVGAMGDRDAMGFGENGADVNIASKIRYSGL